MLRILGPMASGLGKRRARGVGAGGYHRWVIDPDKAVREFMKDIGKTLRPMGFRGSRNLWTAVTDNGKVLIHRSTHNNWRDGGFHEGARGFMLSQQAIPEAWWRYLNWRRQRDGLETLPIEHADIDGPHLMDFHGLPSEPVSPTRHWSIRADYSGGALAADPEDLEFVGEHLAWAVGRLARRGLELIEPARYLKELLNQPKKEIGDWEPIVVLLSEYGPSSALDEAIKSLCDSHHEDSAAPIVEYARSR